MNVQTLWNWALAHWFQIVIILGCANMLGQLQKISAELQSHTRYLDDILSDGGRR